MPVWDFIWRISVQTYDACHIFSTSRPITEWQTKATIDAAQIKTWWAQFPNAVPRNLATDEGQAAGGFMMLR